MNCTQIKINGQNIPSMLADCVKEQVVILLTLVMAKF